MIRHVPMKRALFNPLESGTDIDQRNALPDCELNRYNVGMHANSTLPAHIAVHFFFLGLAFGFNPRCPKTALGFAF